MTETYRLIATLPGETYERSIRASSPEAAKGQMRRAFPGYQISEPVLSENQDSFSEMD